MPELTLIECAREVKKTYKYMRNCADQYQKDIKAGRTPYPRSLAFTIKKVGMKDFRFVSREELDRWKKVR